MEAHLLLLPKQAPGPDIDRGLKAELRLLRRRWPLILGCLLLQWLHGVATQAAYRHHQPAAAPLHDLGFLLLPELPPAWHGASEALFAILLLSFVAWTFTPLLPQQLLQLLPPRPRRQQHHHHQQQEHGSLRKNSSRPGGFSCVRLWSRLLPVLVVCQGLRVLSFSATQLPGPAPHCRLGAPTSHLAPTSAWWQHLVVDVSTQVSRSCGDLLFSSHMTFVLLGALSYTHHGSVPLIKAAAWLAAAAQALLILAARKHYTVDVVVAWYAVPLVYCCLHGFWERRARPPVQQQQQQQRWEHAAAAMAAAAAGQHHHRQHAASPAGAPCRLLSLPPPVECGGCGGWSCCCSCYSRLHKGWGQAGGGQAGGSGGCMLGAGGCRQHHRRTGSGDSGSHTGSCSSSTWSCSSLELQDASKAAACQCDQLV